MDRVPPRRAPRTSTPSTLRDEIDEVIERVFNDVNNGVYRCGFAGTQEAYDTAYDAAVRPARLAAERLADQRYLVGDTITEADVRLFTTLVRFDAVYHGHFKCNRQKLTELPVLWAYARDLFQTPGFGDTIDFAQIKQHYYVVHTDINPTGIVPRGPGPRWLVEPARPGGARRPPFGDGTPPGRRGRRARAGRATGSRSAEPGTLTVRRAVTAVVVLALVAGAALLAVWRPRPVPRAHRRRGRTRHRSGPADRRTSHQPARRWRRSRPTVDQAAGDDQAGAAGQATCDDQGRAPPTKPPATRAKPTPPAKPVAGVPKRPKNAQRMVVRYVYDGDTLQLQAAKPGRFVTTKAKIKVRLIGVDAPEMTPEEAVLRAAGHRSAAASSPRRDRRSGWPRTRTAGTTTGDGCSTSGPPTGGCWTTSWWLGGYGRALRIWPNVTYAPVTAKAQAAAQKKKLGLWKAC